MLLSLVASAFPDDTTFTNATFTERGTPVSVSEWKYWALYVALLAVLLVAAVVAEELWAPILYTLNAFTIVPVVLPIGAR